MGQDITDAETLLALEDLAVGQHFTSGTHVLDTAQIKSFAVQFDPQRFHLDEVAAHETLLGGLAGGGAPFAGGLSGAGGEIAWPRPTRPGDVLQVFSEVIDIKPSRSRPERGMVTLRSETRNQHGDVLQILTAKLVVERRGSV